MRSQPIAVPNRLRICPLRWTVRRRAGPRPELVLGVVSPVPRCSSHYGPASRTEDTTETAERGGNLRGHCGRRTPGCGGAAPSRPPVCSYHRGLVDRDTGRPAGLGWGGSEYLRLISCTVS